MPLRPRSTVEAIEAQPRCITRPGMAAALTMLSKTDQLLYHRPDPSDTEEAFHYHCLGQPLL